MSVARIKTIVIGALFLLNVFFFAVIIIDNTADARSARQAIEKSCTIVQQNGITIDPDDVKTGGGIRTKRTARDTATEEIIARSVLGATNMTDLGVISLYENPERGTARFYSGGDFEISLHEGVITNSGGTQKTVQKILRDMKLETTALNVSTGTDGETATAVCRHENARVFNCPIEFVFTGDSLKTIKGRYVAGFEVVEDRRSISQVGTALLGFLAWADDEDLNCRHIFSVEAGYQHRIVGSFGEGVIVPAWLIITDKGQFIIDDETGEVRLF